MALSTEDLKLIMGGAAGVLAAMIALMRWLLVFIHKKVDKQNEQMSRLISSIEACTKQNRVTTNHLKQISNRIMNGGDKK